MKRLLAMLCVVVMVFALTACGSNAPAASEANTEGSVSQEPAESSAEAESPAAASDVVVGYMAKNTVDAFHATLNGVAKEILDGYAEDGTIAGWQFFDAQTDPANQISQLEDAITNGCNFIIMLPCEAAGSDPIVKRCAELEIPCIVVNSYTDSTFELATGYAGSDDVQAGEMMADYVMSQIPEGGLYAHMMGVVGSSAQIDRGKGITNKMNADSGWECAGDYPAEWLAEKAVSFATDVITQHGDDLKAILCDNDDMSSAVQAYCNSIDRSDIICIGVDGNKGPLTMIKDGTLGATVFQDGAGQMRYALELIPYIIAGDTTTMEYFNSQIPFILVTKDNVGDYLKN